MNFYPPPKLSPGRGLGPVYGSWLPLFCLSLPSSSVAVWQPAEFYVGNLRNLKRQNANATVKRFPISLEGGEAPSCGAVEEKGILGSGPCPDLTPSVGRGHITTTSGALEGHAR